MVGHNFNTTKCQTENKLCFFFNDVARIKRNNQLPKLQMWSNVGFRWFIYIRYIPMWHQPWTELNIVKYSLIMLGIVGSYKRIMTPGSSFRAVDNSTIKSCLKAHELHGCSITRYNWGRATSNMDTKTALEIERGGQDILSTLPLQNDIPMIDLYKLQFLKDRQNTWNLIKASNPEKSKHIQTCFLLSLDTKLFHIRWANLTLNRVWSPAGLATDLLCTELLAAPKRLQGGAHTRSPPSHNLRFIKGWLANRNL